MPHDEAERLRVPPARDRISGAAIAGGAAISVLMMSHHPHVAHDGAESMLAGAVRMASLGRFVHGVMIALTIVLVFGYWGFARRLGVDRLLVRLGLVTYTSGSIAMVAAAVINGFAFHAMAARYVDAAPAAQEMAATVLAYGWALNQTLAGLGVLAWSVAVVAWSLALVGFSGAWRWIGVLGIAIGAVGAMFFLTGQLRLDVSGFGLFVLAQAVWSVAVGTRLWLAPVGSR